MNKAFSVARSEHTSLRIEQTLVVNHVENQVTLRRMEGLMSRVLLKDEFGQDFVNRTIEIISSVSELSPMSYFLTPTF
jgi:hypothetical protein